MTFFFTTLKIFFSSISDMHIHVYVFDYKHTHCDFSVVWCYVQLYTERKYLYPTILELPLNA